MNNLIFRKKYKTDTKKNIYRLTSLIIGKY